jgi:single-strand DNA-binding protein
MSNSVNKVILVGRLGKDPEVKYTQGGTTVARFTVATDETWKDKDTDQKQTRTEWHNIVAWSKLGEICGEYLKKGRLVYIDGRLQTRTWKDQDGQERKTTEIRADQMVMLGSDENKAKATVSGSAGPEITDDDIPF